MPPLRRGLAVLLAGLSCLVADPLLAWQEAPLPQRIQPILRARMPAAGKPPELSADGETFRAAPGLPCFYDRRGFGCIHIEKPRELAEYLLKDDPAWTSERIDAALAKGREQWAAIPRPLPVHLAYWTAWMDDQGVVQFRKDVYGRDKPLFEILEPLEAVSPPPAASSGRARSRRAGL
jgi:hypothetical protein